MRRDHFTVVPVENAAVAPAPLPGSEPLPHTGPPLVVPALPTSARSTVERTDFSLAGCIRLKAVTSTELNGWVGRMFMAFRDLELRLQIAEFAAAFARPT
jgi:hypothetical protein